jgi:hypothetical protein
LAEASITQTSPIAIDGPAASRAADRLAPSEAAGASGGRLARRSSAAVEAVCRAIVVARRRQVVVAQRWWAGRASLSVEGYEPDVRNVK